MYDVIIPLYDPGEEFKSLIHALNRQTILPSNIILAQTLPDGDHDSLKKMGIKEPLRLENKEDFSEIFKNTGNDWGDIFDDLKTGIIYFSLKKSDFDHAGTRKKAVSFSKEPYFICMTQDAVPKDEYLAERLLEPLLSDAAKVSYGRQLPKNDAGIVEEITRSFNYPEGNEWRIKRAKDMETLGIKAFFCSNVCAAYNRSFYDRKGGFSEPAVFNEDMVFARAVLDSKEAIAYVPMAQVFHSHNHTLMQDYSRSFDLGVSQGMHPEVFACVSSESEGVGYVITVIRELIRRKHPLSIPGFILHAGARFAGYRMGKRNVKNRKS